MRLYRTIIVRKKLRQIFLYKRFCLKEKSGMCDYIPPKNNQNFPPPPPCVAPEELV